MGGNRLAIRDDLSAAELHRLARREPDRVAAAQVQAIAGALEGLTRTEAARLAGVERQALRDAVLRYNAVPGAGGKRTVAENDRWRLRRSHGRGQGSPDRQRCSVQDDLGSAAK